MVFSESKNACRRAEQDLVHLLAHADAQVEELQAQLAREQEAFAVRIPSVTSSFNCFRGIEPLLPLAVALAALLRGPHAIHAPRRPDGGDSSILAGVHDLAWPAPKGPHRHR
jgi:hypothetical protein